RVRLDADLDAILGHIGECVGWAEGELVLFFLIFLLDHGRLERAHARELGGLEVILRPPWAGEDGFDEELVGGVDGHDQPPIVRARSRVCSARRSRDRRASWYWRSWSSRRAMASWSSLRSASACSACV